jgi:four helix bundle suffix protein
MSRISLIRLINYSLCPRSLFRLTAVTRTFSLFAKQELSMMAQSAFASGFSTSATARVSKWCRPRVPANKTLSKEARPREFKETEIKLMNVARASLEELLEDYRDFLRVRGWPLWDKNSREARFVRGLGNHKDSSYETYKTYIETRPPAVVANILICLIHQTKYLLDQQLRQLENAFLKEGGLRERMTRARLSERSKLGH